MEDENTEGLSLEYSSEDLKESSELMDDDFEFEPPEDNKAKKLNVNNIFIVIGVAFLLVILIIVSVSKMTKIRKKESAELDKAGTKFIPDIKIAEKDVSFPFLDDSDDDYAEDNPKKNSEDIINDLPDDFKMPEPGAAPVSVTGSGTSAASYKSDRPDTRNSNSIRKIEGIAGQEYGGSSVSNQSLIADAMNGYYGNRTSSAGNNAASMSREDYIANILKQSQLVNQASYGSYGQNQNASQLSQTNKESFYNNAVNNAGQGQYLSYASLWDGTIITGALVTAINTDNPGVVIARVTENVYSSYDSSFLLIPEGTLLYATYNSSVSYGQNRVQIAWNLMIRPDGYRIELGNMNGVDSQGMSGTKGFATNHPFETMKALGLVAMFSIIQTEISNDIKTQNNEYLQNSMSDVYSEASKLGNKIVDRALDIKPTIRIKQGTVVKFITNTPLELPPVKVNQVNRKYVRTN
ncbi:MAG: TrbI/VirB10 family protein [Treponema sp.]|nr:TrbI/VirB10 family protein [Treponema sp.]